MAQSKKLGLTAQILIAMALGILVGLTINGLIPPVESAEEGRNWLQFAVRDVFVGGILEVVGDIFIRALKLLVVPLVFVSLVCGTAALEDLRKLGRIGGRTVAFYLGTTAVAISLAMGLALLFKPGADFPKPENLVFEARESPPLTEVITNIFPANPIEAMAQGNMLQIIVFAILFGIAMTLTGEPGRRLLKTFQALNEVILKLVFIIILLAPYGVFALITRTFANEGLSAIPPLAGYFVLVIVALLIHGLVTYPVLLKVFSGLSPIMFLRKMREAQSFAFSTASSNATIPITMETVERKLGADNRVSSFTVPLGATINMDGTAIMQGVATIFIAQAYGIDLSLGALLTVILTATLASIGTAGVPGVGLIMLALVLQQAGLPVEGIALIIGIDRILDMLRTAVNITGDATVTTIVAKAEGYLDEETFNDPNADAELEQRQVKPVSPEADGS